MSLINKEELTMALSEKNELVKAFAEKHFGESLFNGDQFNFEEMVRLSKDFLDTFNAGEVIYVGYTGSRLFGTSTPESDYDLIVLFKPSLSDLVLKQDEDLFDTLVKFDEEGKFKDMEIKRITLEGNDKYCIDLKFMSVYKFIKLLAKGDINSIDLIFALMSDVESYKTKDVDLFVENHKGLLTNSYLGMVDFAVKQVEKYMVKGDRVETAEQVIAILEENPGTKLEMIKDQLLALKFVDEDEEKKSLKILSREFGLHLKSAYVRKEVQKIRDKYGSRSETSKEQGGVDYKGVSHALRTFEEIDMLIENGFIKFPLPSAEYFLQVKSGNLFGKSTEEVVSEIFDKYDRLKEFSLNEVKYSKRNQDPLVVEKVLLGLYNMKVL